MPLPDRPVSHASIESVWGQQIHDYTFAPAGCHVHGTAGAGVGTTLTKHNLSVPDDDPGGYLDAGNNQVEVPADGGGLYAISVGMNTVSGSAGAGFGTRSHLRLNGTAVASGKEDNAGGTNVPFNIPWLGVLTAGDILEVYSQRVGAGTSPTVTVLSFVMYRVGAEFGAP